MNSSGKVVVVGTGFVGSCSAYAMMLDGIVSELVLIDQDKQKAEGHALDLTHGMQFAKTTKITAGDSFELVKGAEIIVMTAGIAQKEGQSRAELLEKNVSIFKKIIPEIIKYNKDCILLIVTNPLDIMTNIAYKLSGFNKCKVFGTGTVLDTARLRYLLGEHFKVSPKDITAYILGEHGDSQFVWWSKASIAGVSLEKIMKDTKEFFEAMHKEVKNSVYEVIKRKGATYFAIALIVSKIVRAILLDQSRVFTVSTILNDYQGINDICMSVPTIVKRSGICKNLDIELNDTEKKLLDISVDKIKSGIEEAKKFMI